MCGVAGLAVAASRRLVAAASSGPCPARSTTAASASTTRTGVHHGCRPACVADRAADALAQRGDDRVVRGRVDRARLVARGRHAGVDPRRPVVAAAGRSPSGTRCRCGCRRAAVLAAPVAAAVGLTPDGRRRRAHGWAGTAGGAAGVGRRGRRGGRRRRRASASVGVVGRRLGGDGAASCVGVAGASGPASGGGAYGAWPVCGAVPSTFAGGGNCSTGTPSMSRLHHRGPGRGRVVGTEVRRQPAVELLVAVAADVHHRRGQLRGVADEPRRGHLVLAVGRGAGLAGGRAARAPARRCRCRAGRPAAARRRCRRRRPGRSPAWWPACRTTGSRRCGRRPCRSRARRRAGRRWRSWRRCWPC